MERQASSSLRRRLTPTRIFLNRAGGRACIRGMRIPVSVIVGQIAYGASINEILEGYPDLERDDVVQALQYAAWLTQERTA